MKMNLSRKVRELVSVHGHPSREVYFDLENSGYLPEGVVEAMPPYLNKIGYGHPSITHKKPGWEALELVLVYETKEHVAETINAENPESTVFTHSGTEANNLAILGYLTRNRGRKGKVLVSAVEHLSVILPAQAASELFGFKGFLYIEGEALTVELSARDVYVSSGSACSSRVFESSHVLLAIGRKHEEAHGSILFKLSQYRRQEDIDYTPEVVPGAVERLRSTSAWKRGGG
jgi:cysteine sulfinate desulfinase/cysteine desulfurase-like protein